MHTTATRNHRHGFLVRSAVAAGLTAVALAVTPFPTPTAHADQAAGDGGTSTAVTDTSSRRHPTGYAIDQVVDWLKSEMAQYRVAHAAELGHL